MRRITMSLTATALMCAVSAEFDYIDRQYESYYCHSKWDILKDTSRDSQVLNRQPINAPVAGRNY